MFVGRKILDSIVSFSNESKHLFFTMKGFLYTGYFLDEMIVGGRGSDSLIQCIHLLMIP